MKKLKLSFKLLASFGLVLILMSIIMAIFEVSLVGATKSFASLAKRELHIADLVADIEVSMLQCRRNEKDFLLGLDEKYAAKQEESCDLLKQKAMELQPLV